MVRLRLQRICGRGATVCANVSVTLSQRRSWSFVRECVEGVLQRCYITRIESAVKPMALGKARDVAATCVEYVVAANATLKIIKTTDFTPLLQGRALVEGAFLGTRRSWPSARASARRRLGTSRTLVLRATKPSSTMGQCLKSVPVDGFDRNESLSRFFDLAPP